MQLKSCGTRQRLTAKKVSMSSLLKPPRVSPFLPRQHVYEHTELEEAFVEVKLGCCFGLIILPASLGGSPYVNTHLDRR